MSVTHSHGVFVNVKLSVFHSAIAVTVHEVVVALFGIEHIAILGCVVGSDAICHAFLDKVVAKFSVVLASHGDCHVHGTLEVALRKHFIEHQLALVNCGTSFKRYNHLVGHTSVNRIL